MFEVTEDHLGLSEKEFVAKVLSHPPEIDYVSSKAHLALSIDELKCLLSTHDDCHRRAERTIRIGKDDDGVVISAKSACALLGIGGSHYIHKVLVTQLFTVALQATTKLEVISMAVLYRNTTVRGTDGIISTFEFPTISENG